MPFQTVEKLVRFAAAAGGGDLLCGNGLAGRLGLGGRYGGACLGNTGLVGASTRNASRSRLSTERANSKMKAPPPDAAGWVREGYPTMVPVTPAMRSFRSRSNRPGCSQLGPVGMPSIGVANAAAISARPSGQADIEDPVVWPKHTGFHARRDRRHNADCHRHIGHRSFTHGQFRRADANDGHRHALNPHDLSDDSRIASKLTRPEGFGTG